MSKIKDFIMGLSKSTKITLISCGSFVLLTLLILTFFVLFPITPSEKAIASLGREGLVYQVGGEEEGLVTTAVTMATVPAQSVTTVSHTTPPINSDVKFTFTTVSKFFSGGFINAEDEPNYDGDTQTTPIDPEQEEPDEPYGGEEPTYPIGTSLPVVTEPPTEPPTEDGGEQPTSPVVPPVTEPPVEQTTPPVVEPPVVQPTSPPDNPTPVEPEA